MADLYFEVQSNYREVSNLRDEVLSLERALRSFGPVTAANEKAFNNLQAQLTNTRTRLHTMVGEAQRAGAEIDGSIRRGVDSATKAINRLRADLNNPLQATVSIVGLGALGGFLNQIKSVRSQFQLMETSMGVMLQSEKKGAAMMSKVQEIASKSPLTMQHMASKAQQMLMFNVAENDIPKYLKAIGDISMGDSRRFDSLTGAFSRMTSEGKLTGRTLRQMITAGFQPLQIMSEKTGKSIGQLKTEMSKGKITAEMVQQTIIDATSAGGKFYQMSDKASKTISGQLSMLSDALDQFYNSLGKKSEGSMIKIIQATTWLVKNYEKLMPTIGTVIATLGVYKATTIAAAYAEKAAEEDRVQAVLAGYNAEIAKLQELKQKRAEANGVVPLDTTPKFQRGARYDMNKSKDLQEQIVSNRRANLEDRRQKFDTGFTQQIDDIDNRIDTNNKGIDTYTKPIAESKADLAQAESELSELEERSQVLQKRHATWTKELERAKERNRNGMAPEMEANAQRQLDKSQAEMDANSAAITEKKDSITGIQGSIDSLTSERDALIKDNKTLEAERKKLQKQSDAIVDSFKKEEEEIDALDKSTKGLAASDGSLAQKKNQLSTFQDAYDAMSPEEQTSDFGQQLHEQIEGLKADLSGVANLDSDIAESLSIGDISSEYAQELQKMRNELADSIQLEQDELTTVNENIKLKEDEVKALHDKTEAAQQAVDSLGEYASEEDQKAAMEALSAAQTEENTAKEELNTLAKKQNELATRLDADQKAYDNIATQANTAATQANTAAENTNTVSEKKGIIARVGAGVATAANTVKTKAHTIALRLQKGAIDAVKRSVDNLKAAWASNPLGIILTAVTAIGGALYSYFSAKKDSAEEEKKFAVETQKTVSNVELLYATLNVASKNSKVYKDSLEELKGIAKDYGLQIKDEVDLHQQLIEKKDKLIELIKEEGKQRALANAIENVQKDSDEARSALKDKIANSIGGDNKDTYAEMIVGNLDFEKIDKLIKESEELQNRRTSVNNFDLEGKIAKVNNEITAEIERASKGASEVYKQIEGKELQPKLSFLHTGDKNDDSLKKSAKQITANNAALTNFNQSINESKHATEELSETAEKSYKDMDPSKLNEEMKKTVANIKTGKKEVEEVNKSTVKPKGDSSEVKNVKESVKDTKKEVEKTSSTTVKPKGDSKNAKEVTESVKDTGKAVDETNDKTVEPQADHTSIDSATAAAQQTKSQLDLINETIASPTIDTTSIDNALSQLQLIKITLNDINGKHSGYATQEDIDEYNRVAKKVKVRQETINGKTYTITTGKKEDVEKYKSLHRAMTQGDTRDFGKGLGVQKLNDYEQRYFYAFDQHNEFFNKDGSVNENALPEGWKTQYNKIRDAHGGAKQRLKESQKAFDEQIKALSDQIDSAKTYNEIKDIPGQLTSLMGDLEPDSPESKKANNLLNKSQKKAEKLKPGKKNKSGNNFDPKDEAWQRKEDKRKRDQERDDAIAKRDQERKDAEIEAMPDGVGKEIVSSKNTATKDTDSLERETRDLAQSLMEKDRKAWIDAAPKGKDGKVAKGNKRYAYMWDEKAKAATDPQTFTEYYDQQIKNGVDYDKITSEEDYYAGLSDTPRSLEWYQKVAKERNGYADQIVEIEARKQRELKKIYDQQHMDMVEYLKDNGDAQQKLWAMQEFYKKKIEEAKDSEDYAEVFKLTIEFDKEKNAQQFDALLSSIHWDALYSDLDRFSLETLEEMRKQLDVILNNTNKQLTAEQRNQLYSKVDEITNKQREKKQILEENGFSLASFIPGLKERNAQKREEQDANDALSTASNRKMSAHTEHYQARVKLTETQTQLADQFNNVLGGSIKPEEITSETFDKLYSEISSKSPEELKQLGINNSDEYFADLSSKRIGLTQQEEDVINKEIYANNADIAYTAAKDKYDEIQKGSFRKSIEIADGAIKGVNSNIQSMTQLTQELGVEDTKFGKGMEKFAESSQYATDAFDSLKSGDVVGVITNMMGAFRTLGESLGEWGIKFFGASDVDLAKDIEKLTAVNQVLTKSIEALTEEMSESTMSETTEEYQAAMDNINKSIENTQNLMQRSAAEYSNGFLGIGGKSSSNAKINKGMSSSDWQRISEAVGKNISSAADIWNLSSKEMYNLMKNAPEEYAKLKDLADDGYADASQFMDEYADYWKQLKEQTEAYYEEITALSFDSLKSNFTDAIDAMNGTLSGLSDNFQTMMQDAVVNSLMKNKYNDEMEDWYERFAKAMENGLTQEDVKELRDSYLSIGQSYQNELEEMYDTLGLDEIYSQEASAKTYTGMTQEQGTEVSGRLTAITSTTEQIRQLTVSSISGISANEKVLKGLEISTDTILPEVVSINDQLSKTSLDIAEIREYTEAIVKPIKAMKDYVKDIRESVQNI
jgi:tape measure domain-containing protein